VELLQKAVSDQTGTGRLFRSDINQGDHRVFDSADGRPSIPIETVSLDQFLANHAGRIDFIKFDIQGSEWAAIQGMKALLERQRRLKMITEFWPFGLKKFGVVPADYLNLLLQLGFRIYEVDEAQQRVVPADSAQLLQTYTAEKENFTNLFCFKGDTEWEVVDWEAGLTETRPAVPVPATAGGESTRQAWLWANDLRAFECRTYSQNGEDGILEEIFRRLGERPGFLVEFGVETGVECNGARLVRERQWRALFIEADEAKFAQLAKLYADCPGVRTVHGRVTSQNIEALLLGNHVPEELDLLSIDIDGNDYWVWAAVRRWRPRVVVIEYNAAYPPPQKWVMKENGDHAWNGTDYYGASLASLMSLGRKKGYVLVATNSTGVNAFFVREDLAGDGKFLDPALYYHYSPPAFGSRGGGHPPGEGEFVEI
jgi:hypothetical protein